MKLQFFSFITLFACLFTTAISAKEDTAEDPEITHKVYFDINHGDKQIGRIVMGLYGLTTPQTVENFYQLTISRDPKMGYLNSIFHRVIPNFMIQGGDFTTDQVLGVSLSSETRSKMRILMSNMTNQADCLWPIVVKTPTDPNFSSPPSHAHGWTVSTLSLEKSWMVWT